MEKKNGKHFIIIGNNVGGHFEEIDIGNPLFGMIFRKYPLDLISENIKGS